MIRSLFFSSIIALSAFFGYRIGDRLANPCICKYNLPIDPQKEYPLTHFKSFAFVIHSDQRVDWCEKALCSIFEQNYDHFRIFFFDDASQDGTFEKVRSFIEDNNQGHRAVLIRNKERLGATACLNQAASQMRDDEIAIPMDAKDWLAHPKVLDRLNRVYQNPDVWLTAALPLLYPTYETALPLPCVTQDLPPQTPVSFYAGLFKQIRLADLVREGQFIQGRDGYLRPIIQMTAGRNRVLNEPLFLLNTASSLKEIPSKSHELYSPSQSIVKEPFKGKVDILLFSYDRPLQLYACLESISRYFSGYEKISVICRASGPSFRRAYQKVKDDFPEVVFQFEEDSSKKKFKPLLLETLASSASAFVLFGVDDQIVTDFVNLQECAEMMEGTQAYGFYLRLGKQITYSYQMKEPQSVPQSVCIRDGVYAWNIQIGYTDWEFPNTLDMTLYKKADLTTAFEKMNYKHPNSLEFGWAKKMHPQGEIGLYFGHSKVVNIPLNIVRATGNPHMLGFSLEELLSKFEQGLKIWIDPLYRIDNASPHVEYDVEFIPR